MVIGDALAANTSLRMLSLDANPIGRGGARAIMRTLAAVKEQQGGAGVGAGAGRGAGAGGSGMASKLLKGAQRLVGKEASATTASSGSCTVTMNNCTYEVQFRMPR